MPEKRHSIQDVGEAIAVIKRDLDEMKPDVKQTTMCVTVLSTQMKVVREDVANLKKRVFDVEVGGHECEQEEIIDFLQQRTDALGDKVEKDIQRGVETRERLAATSEKVARIENGDEKNSSFRKNIALWIIGIVIGLAGSGASAVWYLAGHDAEVRRYIATSSERISGNTKRVKEVEDTVRSNQKAVIEEIKSLRSDVMDQDDGDTNRGVTSDEWYEGRSPGDKARLRNVQPGG